MWKKNILVPTGCALIGQHQESRPLAGPDILRMNGVLISYFQPIRFARFDKKSVNSGLSKCWTSPEVAILGVDVRSGPLRTRMGDEVRSF